MRDEDMREELDAKFAIQDALMAYADIEEGLKEGGAFKLLLETARERAVRALVALITVDPTKPDGIRMLQNQIAVYGLYCKDLLALLDEGDRAVEDKTAEDVRDIMRFGQDDQPLGD